MAKVKLCTYCNETERDKCKSWSWIYFSILDDDNYICPHCGKQLVDTAMEEEDEWVLANISDDINFLEAMIKLKETDIIEYESRMSQFRNQVQQQEQAKQTAKENSKPRCPHCNSTNIKSISGLNRGASIAMWGIFSKKINKSFECKNCGYTW